MIEPSFAKKFAQDWVDAWNSHDLERIQSHYADGFTMVSPFIVELAGEVTGTLRGRKNTLEYWALVLKNFPDIKFELIDVLVGVDTISIYYKSVNGRRALEHVELGPNAKAIRASAHYSGPA